MTRERIFIYDTTLRDGQQAAGIQFSTADKIEISTALDEIGIDYIEGGWPGANPTDSDFFSTAPKLKNSNLTAFGMTKQAGKSAENDNTLAAVVNSGAESVCLVGKAHDFHVSSVLNISLEDNLENIRKSIKHLVDNGREAVFDAEHFFDGYKDNRAYAIRCVEAALLAGARWVVLCDTNGGTLPEDIRKVTSEVANSIVPPGKLGIHTHNDSAMAVAGSLAAVDAGARQIQGTINGIGERCGNANLISIIPALLLKEPYCSKFESGISSDGLRSLTRLSRQFDEILNRVPDKSAPYVGASAFTHKAGLHASGVLKDPSSYEHIRPDTVGNHRTIPMSNQAGRSNLRRRLSEAGIEIDSRDPRLALILDEVKTREDRGYSYDSAEASFEILARQKLGILPEYFRVNRYRVMVERRRNERGELVSVSEAVVVLRVGGARKLSVSEGLEETGRDSGPVHALSKAIAKDLGPYQDCIDDMRLVDFKVRITSGGTEAVTRVIIDCEDRSGARWSTVGASPNIINASFEALKDAIVWKLVREGPPVA
ncbi:MAG: citramalate synthase [Albidovulum sp.]|nr:citramalate synthase [Albidovulum sp.]MDE0531061.1 citramalate synthase [Albidovulum sp.]